MSARMPESGAGLPRLLPSRLGKYALTGVLGEGAMGVVYKGMDPDIQRPVAIKTIRTQLFEPSPHDMSAAERFRREAQAAGRLAHPGIVAVYEYGEEAGNAYIAMEYVHGHGLARYMGQPERIAEDDVLSIMVQLLEALHHAHEQGVWHRDIKPGNLMLTQDGRLKVADFGIARIDSSQTTQVSVLIGTPLYMAPERYAGDTLDRRVDVFSCGVLMYQLLTGKPPFPGPDNALMYQVLNTTPQPPSQLDLSPRVPAHFDAIVARAIAKEPTQRFGSAMEFRDALLAAAARPISRTVSQATLARVKPPPDMPARGGAGSAPRRSDSAGAGLASSRASTPSTPSTDPSRAGGSLPRSAPTTAPQTAPPPTGWDVTLLAGFEALLAHHVGPVARVLVRRTAKASTDVPSLVARLAELIPAGKERTAFVHAARAVAPGAAQTPPAPADATVLYDPGGQSALSAELVERVQRHLARHVGPIAQVLVKKAAARAQSAPHFVALVADQAELDAAQREELSRLL